ncbi:flagellar export protein FliJ [Sulfuricella sp.]|uniref:flagellar export protein FliJ n=1 Tax=Sulfuricella sp. TaxID=2099377 RepID=UPI002C34780E|nr:flagellar export protein FliJ [Sulfuricella sp.]HUX63924.1 flagellar export protein FliJ [Sulfuricella sp.]
MPRRFPLQPLLDLAQNHTDAAARDLHTLKVGWQEAEEKFRQLTAYREDYRAKLLQTTKLGMQVSSLRDFQLFLGKIEVAIRQQAEEVERCKKRWEDGRYEWQAKQRKLKAFDTLSQRHLSSERKREDKLEQREQDELSGNKFKQEESTDPPYS